MLAAAAVLLSGCGLIGVGGDDPTDPASTGADPGPSPTMPSEIPSWLLECGAEDGGKRNESLQLTTLDLTQATWSMPAGYQQASGYVEDNPVEELYSDWVAEPTDPPLPGLNVLSIVIYTGIDWGDLADGCGRVPLEAVEEKLSRYRDQIGAEPLSEAEMTEVDGLPAIHQFIGLESYDYTGYWLFTESQLMHIYCQWTDDAYKETIVEGCDVARRVGAGAGCVIGRPSGS